MSADAATRQAVRTGRRLYRPLDHVVLRAPLLPVERYLALAATGSDAPATAALTHLDEVVRHALAVASPSMGTAAEAAVTAGIIEPGLQSKLLRYLIRMSTRPTPYGLFAGVGLAAWADRTDLTIDGGPRPTRTRPDMGWLLPLALGQEAEETVRRSACLLANTCAFERDGRIYLSETVTPGRGSSVDVSVRASPVVRRALELARRPVPCAQLVDALTGVTPGATPEQVQALLDELWRQDLLISELRPPLTRDPPAYLADRLARTVAGRATAGRLMELLASLRAADRAPGQAAAAALPVLARRAGALAVNSPPNTLQVDSALPLRGRELCAAVAEDAALAAELLLRLHPAPGGSWALTAYRHAFLERYGHERLVALPELLDPRFGLGPLSGHARHGRHDGSTADTSRREDRLLDLAVGALQDNRSEVRLEPGDLDELSVWTPDDDQVPASLELSAILLARNRAEVDRRDYRLMVGPGLGAGAAGRGLGRFADLLGEPAARALHRAARAEEIHHPHAIRAELAYLPTHLRAANVAIRWSPHDHEIAVGVTPGVPPDRVIPVDELAVGVQDGRLRLWWARRGVEVRVTAGHMLNTRSAPQVCRFLHEVCRDGITDLHEFNWGQAAGLPRLPRVVHGRIVLSPAQWLLRASTVRRLVEGGAAAFPDSLATWREYWRVPRRVYLSDGDNRLLLDLEDGEQVEVLRRELRQARGRSTLLQEALPAPEHAWLPGPGGRFICELVVPLVRRAPRTRASAPPAPRLPPPAIETQRRRPPGSEWLYLKLYGPRARQNELIVGPLLRFAEAMTRSGCVRGWFFLRYADPGEHLRFRLQGDPAVLAAEVLPAAARWAGELVARGRCTEWSTAVYERELERYGGLAGTVAAESAFAADSASVARLLALCCDAPIDPVELAVLTIDDLVGSLGLDEQERTQVYGSRPPSREAGREYRHRKDRLRALLESGPQGLGKIGDLVAEVLEERRAAIVKPATELRALARRGELSVPVTDIAASLVHLHLNRMSTGPNEATVLDLLRRTHETRLALQGTRRIAATASGQHR